MTRGVRVRTPLAVFTPFIGLNSYMHGFRIGPSSASKRIPTYVGLFFYAVA